ncbi:MAG TPA: class I SAM-dependent methyltransferase [Polyangiaceae bacterium]|nr:class I SAM-dependent methyltransferase [Polyangiaceae bacterium]
MIPEDTESPPCPLCAASQTGVVVGERGRFGMQVRNLACDTCGLVYVTPRPDHAAMMDYYRGTYREHYGEVRYPTPSGGTAGPGQPEYTAALEAWHSTQADNCIALGGTRRGARVLEIGCRHARTLQLMRARLGVDAHGVEPGPEEAAEACAAGVRCFTGTLEEYEPDAPFDQIQLFHVLEHFHDPLAQLVRLRGMLAPGGKLVIEVPNLYQPYGLLEENFFQNVHLMSFSPNTLPALCRRAGLSPLRVLDRGALFVVAQPDPLAPKKLPLAFQMTMLPDPTESAEWVAERLATYARLEKEHALIKIQGPSMEGLENITTLLGRPGLPSHTAQVVAELCEFFMRHGSPRAACVIATAASGGPHAAPLRRAFYQLAQVAAQAVQPGAPPSLG